MVTTHGLRQGLLQYTIQEIVHSTVLVPISQLKVAAEGSKHSGTDPISQRLSLERAELLAISQSKIQAQCSMLTLLIRMGIRHVGMLAVHRRQLER